MKTVSKYTHCAVDENCDNKTLWIIGGEPRCLKHIPREIDHPIALWGDDWLATGRSVIGAGGGRHLSEEAKKAIRDSLNQKSSKE